MRRGEEGLRVGSNLGSWVLAVEGRNRPGRSSRVGVLLEVDQAAGEEKDVTSVQSGREERVCREQGILESAADADTSFLIIRCAVDEQSQNQNESCDVVRVESYCSLKAPKGPNRTS